MVRRILMVCSGNYCRSPIAEAVMRSFLQKCKLEDDFDVDSAGLYDSYCGMMPEERALNVLRKNNISYTGTARMVEEDDFFKFDYMFAMDTEIMECLKRMRPKLSNSLILLLGHFGLPEDDNVIEDPHNWIGERPFERVYEKCVSACEAFIGAVLLNKI